MSDTPSTPSDATSASLLERARADDPAAWERLVHVYSPLVYSWGRRGGLSDDDAADVMQEVFRSVAAALGRFRRDRPGDTFRGWLWSITRNKLRDHYRAARERPEAAGGSQAQQRLLEVAADAPEPGDDPADPGAAGLLHRALDVIRGDFEERTWRAFWRTAIDGQSAAAVADELGLRPDAVYQAKARVLRRLREEMRGLID